MFKALFTKGPTSRAGGALYSACAKAARRPFLYADLGVPDTVEGRFELYALHVLLVVRRLKGGGDAAREVSQALFDSLLRGLDDGLREMGVGDLSVGKKMRKLGEALYGRAKNLDEALDVDPTSGQLEAFLGRTVFADQPEAAALALGLSPFVRETDARLAAQPLDAVISGVVEFEEKVQ
jgi:cytochrome b pre-mRNA-processing protein 3